MKTKSPIPEVIQLAETKEFVIPNRASTNLIIHDENSAHLGVLRSQNWIFSRRLLK